MGPEFSCMYLRSCDGCPKGRRRAGKKLRRVQRADGPVGDPGTLEVTYATAGHPPAILVDRNGAAQLLQYDGLPLGIQRESSYRTFSLMAEHDSLLVLYTDGLIEYDHDLIEGEQRMLESAKNVAVQRLSDPAGAIEDAIFKNHEPLDDVAILTIAFRDSSIDRADADSSERWSIGLRGKRAPYPAARRAQH